jgi:hypothetical protein
MKGVPVKVLNQFELKKVSGGDSDPIYSVGHFVGNLIGEIYEAATMRKTFRPAKFYIKR